MKRIPTYILIALAAVLNTACNSDIFVEDTDLPEISDVTVEGDGGQWSTAFSRIGLSSIQLDCSSDDREYLRYYDMKGAETDPDCPPSELGSFVCENPKTYYSIGFIGDMMYLTSFYNASYNANLSVRFDYDYGVTKTVNITLTEGKKLQLYLWEPDGEMKIEDNITTSTHVTSLTNNSSLTQKLEIYPFLDSRCSDIVTPSDNWARGMSVDLPIPTFNGKGWEWREYKDIVLENGGNSPRVKP